MSYRNAKKIKKWTLTFQLLYFLDLGDSAYKFELSLPYISNFMKITHDKSSILNILLIPPFISHTSLSMHLGQAHIHLSNLID